MKIVVTEEMIRCGVRHNTACCPVALAVRAACPDTTIIVGVNRVTGLHRSTGLTLWRRPLPTEAKQFVRKFDAQEEVAAFEFELT